MDRDEKELFMNLLDRLEAKEDSEDTQTPEVQQKQERPTIFNIGRTSMFGGRATMMPDPQYFRKLLGVDF